MIKKIFFRILFWLILPLALLLIVVSGTSYLLIDAFQTANDNANWYDPVTGIDESYFIEVGGAEQLIQIRGQDKSNPVLVFLHGGPGQPMRILDYEVFKPWTEYFTVVQWDQRGSGASLVDQSVSDSYPMSMGQMISDTVDVIEHIKLKLRVEKVILVGHSWGTVLGINVVEKYPDLFYSYVGFGNALRFQESAALLLEEAIRREDSEGVIALTDIVNNWPEKSDHDGFVSSINATKRYSGRYDGEGGIQAMKVRGDDLKMLLPIMLGSPDVSFPSFIKSMQGTVETYKPLIDYLYDMNLGEELNSDMEVPLFFIQGKLELSTPSIKQWVDALDAPQKTFIEFERSGHLPFIDEPGKTLVTLVQLVRPTANAE